MTREEKLLRMRRHARIRRVKQFLRWMPRKANLNRYPILKWFAKTARKRDYLWSFRIPSCTPAFYFGSIIAFMPLMGVQIGLAFIAALFLRANLPIIIGLQAISNPFTIAVIYPLNLIIGRKAMDILGVGGILNPVMSNVQAILLGGIILGLAVGAVLDLLYRLAVHEAAKLALLAKPPSRTQKTPPAKSEVETAAKEESLPADPPSQ